MGKTNRKDSLPDPKKQSIFKSSRFKKGMATVIVGATVFGVGAPLAQEVGFVDNVVDIEAAEGDAQIFAFDHYVLRGQEYDYLQNVSAFEIVDGEMVDLTDEVDVIGLAPSEDGTSQEVEYRVVGSNGVEVSTTATITYGVNYPGAIQSIEDTIAQVESEIERLDVDDEALQGDIDGLNEQLADLQAQVDAYETLSNDQAADISELEELSKSIQDEMATITRGISHALTDIYDLSSQADSQYALIEDEIASVEEQLVAFEENINQRVEEMESELPEKATQEEVDAVQARVDAFLADTLPIEEGLGAQLTALNILYEDVVNGSLERDEAMSELIAVQEERIDTLQEMLDVLVNDSDGEIARLREQLENIEGSVDADVIQAELDALVEAAEVSEQAYVDQIAAAEEANALLNDRLNGYESVISDLEAELELISSDMTALERILSELERDEENGELPPEENVEDEEPVEESPDGEEPVDEQPEDEQPVDEVPADEEPVDEQPTEETPDAEEPVDEQPDDDQPAEEESTEETPDGEEPVDEQPDDEQPVDEQPTEETPDVEEPVDEKPTDETPVDDTYDPDSLGEEVVVGDTIDDPATDATSADDETDALGSDVTDETPASDVSTTSAAADGAGLSGNAVPDGDGGVTEAEGAVNEGTPVEATESGGGGATPPAEGGEPVEELPQTGASLGAVAAAGASGLVALGAGVSKFLKKRK